MASRAEVFWRAARFERPHDEINVLVTGGTGTLGRHVVMLLRQSGHSARILSREPRGQVDAVQGDLRTGAGLQNAVIGMDAIVHAATAARQPLSLRETDVRGTRRLLELGREANVGHVVYVSIVGIDEAPTFPYYRIKLAAESVVREKILPWSIVRATQFHNLMEIFLKGCSRIPGVIAVPMRWQFQPVHAREVARRVVDVVLGKPIGMLPDFGGPEVRDFKSIAEAWLLARNEQRRLMNLPMPFKFSRQFAAGLVTCPDHKDGVVTFEQYLAETYPLS